MGTSLNCWLDGLVDGLRERRASRSGSKDSRKASAKWTSKRCSTRSRLARSAALLALAASATGNIEIADTSTSGTPVCSSTYAVSFARQ